MDTTRTFDRPLQNRQDPADSDPKGGGYEEPGAGKSGKKIGTDSGDDRSAG
jgi:hypothetical protein